MALTTPHLLNRHGGLPRPSLPVRMRVLYIADKHRTGAWLAEAFAADSAATIELEEARGTIAGLAKLREECYDAVLISHEPRELDALELVEACRGAGADGAIVVLGTQSEQEVAALCYEVGADAYVCANTTTVRSLIWIVGRAVEHHRMRRENRRLLQAEQQRLQREQEESERLLEQQRMLIRNLEAIHKQHVVPTQPSSIDRPADGAPSGSPPTGTDLAPGSLPSELATHYRELLRTYVIMGTGNLASELRRLADLLAVAGVTAPQAMQLHVCVLEELVRRLGSRSTRHVMTRADLLVLEVIMHLAESYRRRYISRSNSSVQQVLPGFEEVPKTLF